MEKAKSYKSWTISAAFWEAIKDEIPERHREESRVYKRKPGGGRKSLPRRQVLEGIFYVLRTGWEWQSVDVSMVKAPLALEAAGHNPTGRGKNGDKTQCAGG